MVRRTKREEYFVNTLTLLISVALTDAIPAPTPDEMIYLKLFG